MSHTLPELPFKKDALEPYISAETLNYHHGKHHAGYVKKLNKLIEGSEFENASLEEIIKSSSGSIFNNAAQIWNHSFYWNCLIPLDENQGGPEGKLLDDINRNFGSFDQFETSFVETATSNFGSGWTWLVKVGSGKGSYKLEVINTDDADTPIAKDDMVPLLVCDIWEHAYYIDYRNGRAMYLEAFLKLLNWRFVEENFE